MTPIFNEEAERAVLGALLLDADAVADVRHFLDVDSFYKEAHRHIYAACLAVVDAGEDLDVVTLYEGLRQAGKLDAVGGLAALSALSDSVATAANAASYARIVARHALYRQALARVAELPERLRGAEPEEALRDAQADLAALAQRLPSSVCGVTGAQASHAQELYDRARDEGAIAPPISTGLLSLDALLGGGLEPGYLHLVVGSAKMGKSSVLRHLTLSALSQGARVLYFATEMGERDMVRALKLQRCDAQITTRQGQHYTWTTLDDAERAAHLLDAHRYLHAVGDRLRIDGTTLIDRLQVLERAEAARRAGGLDVLVVDHLHHLEPTPQEARSRASVGECCRATLKALQAWGEAHDVAVVVAAQARTACKTERRAPDADDVQECKSAMQIAHRILTVHRPSVYDAEASPLIAELCLAAARGLPPGKVLAQWDGPTTSLRPDDGTCADELARAELLRQEKAASATRAHQGRSRRSWP